MSSYYYKLVILILSLHCARVLSPPGMVYIEGGELTRGKDLGRYIDQNPRNTVSVSSFYLDKTLVTISDYDKFTKETGYKTSAERLGSCKISKEGMKNWEWEIVPGVDFRNPYYKNDPKAKVDPLLPAVCLSPLDAIAYCEQQGKRLPTEAEWEYAMRAGSTDRFPWGKEVTLNGKFQLNFWQGKGHENAEEKDGYLYLAPIKSFPPNKFGVYDTVGNVWQITGDHYSILTYSNSKNVFLSTGTFEKDPKGPDSGESYVTRGGSWWCSEATCNGYGLNYRGHIHKYATFNNNGFRCARNVK